MRYALQKAASISANKLKNIWLAALHPVSKHTSLSRQLLFSHILTNQLIQFVSATEITQVFANLSEIHPKHSELAFKPKGYLKLLFVWTCANVFLCKCFFVQMFFCANVFCANVFLCKCFFGANVVCCWILSFWHNQRCAALENIVFEPHLKIFINITEFEIDPSSHLRPTSTRKPSLRKSQWWEISNLF